MSHHHDDEIKPADGLFHNMVQLVTSEISWGSDGNTLSGNRAMDSV